MHGVEIGTAYRNDKSCATFIDCIGKDLGSQLEKKLSAANFFSVLSDSSENSSACEKEAIFVQYLEKNPPGWDTIQIILHF